jgi:MFS family permease
MCGSWASRERESITRTREETMSKRQFAALFLCNLVGWTVGNGLLPLLPLYATRLGAGPVFTGYYLAFAYVTLTASTLLAGWLADTLQRRKAILIVAGLLYAPATWLIGQVPDIYGLAMLTAATWFLGGVAVVVLSTLAALFAEESERGKVFGVLAMTSAMGALLAGLTMGAIADRWGYPTLFLVAGLFFALFPVSALFLEDKRVGRVQRTQGSVSSGASTLGGRFWLLVLSRAMVMIGVFVSALGRSLSMDSLGFPAAAVSSVGIVTGAVSLVRSPLPGWMSDRADRKQLIVLSCFVGAVGSLLLSVSTAVWHFWVATVLQGFLMTFDTVGQALVADWVLPESLGVGMSIFQAAASVGGSIGYACAGHAIGNLGMSLTFLGAACLVVLAVGLLASIRGTRSKEENWR